jgi:hypothetical protein
MIGTDRILRIEPEHQIASIELDDWAEAVQHLPDAAIVSLSENKERISGFFSEATLPRERFYT